MSQLYHQTCPWWRRWWFYRSRQAVSRCRLIDEDTRLFTRTYRCEACRTVLHMDTDWPEDAIDAKSEARV